MRRERRALGYLEPVEVDGLLLAAGAGRRAGGPKALRTDRHGRPWVRHGVEVLLAGGCRRVRVVVGAAAEEVVGLLPPSDRVSVVRCPDWSRGIGASLRSGLAALDPTAGDAVLVHLVDLPDVDAAVVRRVAAGASRASLARATYAGRPGHPVLVGTDHWTSLLDGLEDGDGARGYLVSHGASGVECGDLAGGLDVDGPAPAGTPVPRA